jgi:hypothetical protein
MKRPQTTPQGFSTRSSAAKKLVLISATILIFTILLYQYLSSKGRLDAQKEQEADDWIGWAKVAWSYFQPGVGLNPSTGLHYAAQGWHRFTDWDLGVYISAIIDAERLELISKEGPWGSNQRLEKVLSFLETRPITEERLPYAQYEADTGGVPADIGNKTAHPSDVAKLLLALDDLRHHRPELDLRIRLITSRYNLELLSQSNYFAGNDVYVYYSALGYWAFNLSTPRFKGLDSLGGGYTLEIYGETLPRAGVTTEPLVLAILEGRSSGLYRDLADKVFRVQQKRFEATGKLTAFSEGAYPTPPHYIYEWITTGGGETWIIWAGRKINGSEVVYTKISFAFHAIYNNQYTRTLLKQVSRLITESGFLEGVMEDGTTLNMLTDKTNGMILQAARYAMFSRFTIASLINFPWNNEIFFYCEIIHSNAKDFQTKPQSLNCYL